MFPFSWPLERDDIAIMAVFAMLIAIVGGCIYMAIKSDDQFEAEMARRHCRIIAHADGQTVFVDGKMGSTSSTDTWSCPDDGMQYTH